VTARREGEAAADRRGARERPGPVGVPGGRGDRHGGLLPGQVI